MGRPYTRQFKEQAVKLGIAGQEPARTARELGLPHSTLMIWLRKAGWRRPEPEGALGEDPAALAAQVKDLRRQVKRLEMERDILKKATAYFAKEQRLIVVDKFDLAEIKTKAIVGALATLKADKKALVVDDGSNEKLVKSIRNVAAHRFLPPEGVNVYDLLRHDHLVLTKDAAKKLEERCLK